MKNLLKNIVGAVAPTLGTALGGPMGGMAATMISEVLGVPNNTKAIEKGLAEATPEQMLELKKAEQAFEVQMKELEVYGLHIFSNSSTTRAKQRSIN